MFTRRNALLIGLLAAGVVVGAGCSGEGCRTEPPVVEQLPSCPDVVPGGDVTVGIHICPTCNQTSAECSVDLSGIGAGSGTIFFDVRVQACEDVSSCPLPTPSCELPLTPCRFTAPTVPGTYTLMASDGVSGVVVGDLTVDAGGDLTTCGT